MLGEKMLRKILVSAPGRICLFGEHMDWCRHQVLACAVDMRTFVEAEVTDDNVVEAFSFLPFTRQEKFFMQDLSINWNSDLKYVGGVLSALKKRRILPYKIKGMKLSLLRASDVQEQLNRGDDDKILNDLPVSKGLSSSAAMCVAISAAIDLTHRLRNMDLQDQSSVRDYVSKRETLAFYADTAYTGERKELGINCGQMDQYASAFGGILHIDCTHEPAKVNRLKPKTELPLVIGDTKQPKDTPKILGWLGERFATKETKFIEGMNNIVKIVKEARKELEKPSTNRRKIGELMNENQQYLAEYLQVSGNCPVSPSRLDDLIAAALKAGALGAKLSGSGGGGCMSALCEPGDEDRIAERIKDEGGQAYITKVAMQGIRIELMEMQ
jgi:galactokinase